MSPRIDGSLPNGYVWAYVPELKGTRRMSFLAFRLISDAMCDKRKPKIGVKRGPNKSRARERERANWLKIHANFAEWQGIMEREAR